MSDQSKRDQCDSEPIYWVAIQPARNAAPIVFGPYTQSQATENRAEWLKTVPLTARISMVFRAETRELAEQNVQYYMAKG